LVYEISARTEDGMDLERSQTYDSDRLQELPDEERVLADMERSLAELKALASAPLVEPYTGPAIIRNRAAGVYFHEILGHRLEGHRQKIESEGQTFTKMVGKPVTAPFLTVTDDPTLSRYRGQFLRGHYRFDDEGVPAARALLVENGVLKGFLLSRVPIRDFPSSNGHGRRSFGRDVTPRMGNLIVEASRAVPSEELRRLLMEEARRQGKPYGLLFEDITGGFTATSRGAPQSFKVLPLLVYRVYPDGRPDEAVRGVDIVGTPLTAFTKIVAAGDDPLAFNGTCGAESGWVPVAAVSPSLLVSELEVEKKAKSSEKPPILPPPAHDAGRRP
jgi:predicted Zn-dependent protease